MHKVRVEYMMTLESSEFLFFERCLVERLSVLAPASGVDAALRENALAARRAGDAADAFDIDALAATKDTGQSIATRDVVSLFYFVHLNFIRILLTII